MFDAFMWGNKGSNTFPKDGAGGGKAKAAHTVGAKSVCCISLPGAMSSPSPAKPPL